MAAGGTVEHRLAAAAYGLGFDLVGFARLGVPVTLDAYDAWLAAGRHGTMGYLATSRDLRADATRPEPGMTHAIVVAMNYGGTQPPGPIARYARGRDYHRVLWDRLDQLGDAVRAACGAQVRTRGVTDSAPFLERDLARQAGLGWFGKNAMLISPRLGSFFVLGLLLTDAPLVPSAPFEADRCGTCTRCLDACPTDAFVAPRVLDAQRCIAYLTIEHRGAFTAEEAAMVGTHVFGCDVCQDVCPWNVKFARDVTEPALAPRAEIVDVSLAEWAAMDETEWRRRTLGTALRRAKWEGFRRNVGVVRANTAGPRAP